MPKGTLQGKINELARGIEADIVRDYARVLISALYYCHEDQLVVHRDIKPENIMLNAELEPVMVDFGLSKII